MGKTPNLLETHTKALTLEWYSIWELLENNTQGEKVRKKTEELVQESVITEARWHAHGGLYTILSIIEYA